MKWSSCQIPRSCQSRSRHQQLTSQPQPISCGSISQGIPTAQDEYNAHETCPVRQARPSAFGLRLDDWDKRFDQFQNPLSQEFDGHLTTPVPRDVSTLSQVAGEMRL